MIPGLSRSRRAARATSSRSASPPCRRRAWPRGGSFPRYHGAHGNCTGPTVRGMDPLRFSSDTFSHGPASPPLIAHQAVGAARRHAAPGGGAGKRRRRGLAGDPTVGGGRPQTAGAGGGGARGLAGRPLDARARRAAPTHWQPLHRLERGGTVAWHLDVPGRDTRHTRRRLDRRGHRRPGARRRRPAAPNRGSPIGGRAARSRARALAAACDPRHHARRHLARTGRRRGHACGARAAGTAHHRCAGQTHWRRRAACRPDRRGGIRHAACGSGGPRRGGRRRTQPARRRCQPDERHARRPPRLARRR